MIKKTVKTAAAVLLISTLLFNMVFASETKLIKDEVVYVNLEHDGSVKDINIVNSFKVSSKAEIVDYGEYEELKNLTDGSLPKVSDGTIRWSVDNKTDTFFYQGKVKNKELPWNFAITYSLNGTSIEGEKLAGAKGEIKITISVKANNNTHSYFKENQILQISIPLNTKKCKKISAPGASRMLVGSKETIVYNVMPGGSEEFIIEIDAVDFEMEEITMAITDMNIPSTNEIDEIQTGINDMYDGVEDMVLGTIAFKKAMNSLGNATQDLYNGSKELNNSKAKISDGLENLGGGLDSLNSSLEQLGQNSSRLSEGMTSLAGSSTELTKGAADIYSGLEKMLSDKQQLIALAQAVSQSDDPSAVMLSQAMLAQLEGLSSLYTGTDSLSNGLMDYTKGVSEAAAGFKQLSNGIEQISVGSEQLLSGYKQLAPGVASVYDGINELNKGISLLNDNVKEIPSKIDQLIDAQNQLKDGVGEAKEKINTALKIDNDVVPVSFAAPDKNTPKSVQFVLKTPAIEIKESEQQSSEAAEKQLTIWQRFVNLFVRKNN